MGLPTKKWICEHCDKQHSFKSNLLLHQKTCKGRFMVNIGCTSCGKRFYGNYCKTKLEKHMAWTCSKKGKFTIDMSMFHEKRRLHCPFCTLNFVTIANLGCHIKSAHGIEKPREKKQILPPKKKKKKKKKKK